MKKILAIMAFVLIGIFILTNVATWRICRAIYFAEGGSKTKRPYGIRGGNIFICERTVKRNMWRYVKSGMRGDYITYLQKQYCPGTDGATWQKNVKWFLTKRR